METNGTKKAAADTGLSLAGFIAVSAAVTVLASIPQDLSAYGRLLISGAGVAAACAAGILLMRGCAKEKEPFSVCRMSGRQKALFIPVFLAAFSVYYITGALVSKFNGALGLEAPGSAPLPEGTEGILVYILCRAVIPAVMEELLFRGCILRRLLPAGEWNAVWISSLFFALSHWNMQRIVPVFVVSLFLSFAYLESGSMAMPVMMHLLNNLAGTGIIWAGARFGEKRTGEILLYTVAAGVVCLLAFIVCYRGGRERKISAEEAEWSSRDYFLSGEIIVVFLLYAVMMFRGL